MRYAADLQGRGNSFDSWHLPPLPDGWLFPSSYSSPVRSVFRFVLAFLRIFSTFFRFVSTSFGFVFSALLLMLKDLLGSFRIF